MKRILAALVMAVAFLSSGVHATPTEVTKPMLLVASPSLSGEYAETVVMVNPISEQHFGFILNKPSTASMASLFPDDAATKGVTDPANIGGPNSNSVIFAIVRGHVGDHALPVAGLSIAHKATDIDNIIATKPNEARYFIGYVAWNPGELAAELAKGYWIVIELDEDVVMRHDTSGLWVELLTRTGVGRPDPVRPSKFLTPAKFRQ